MKRIAAWILALTAALTLTACGGGEAYDPAAEEGTRVAVIADYADITDQSFNQFTYEASRDYCAAHDLKFTYYKPEADSTADRVAMVDKAVADGYNVIILPGYTFGSAIVETAEMYPDIKYLAIDMTEGDLQGNRFDNVCCAGYQEQIAGYMAGRAAVKLGYSRLGFLGGMAVPGVMRYGYGFVQGADDAAAETGAQVEMNYAYGNQFTGDADITAAMDTWYRNGTKVVFACGGGIFTSVGEAASKAGGKIIGVDVDQSEMLDEKYGEGITVTSAMKSLEATVNAVLDAIQNDRWEEYGGHFMSLGLISGDDPSVNFTQLAETTQWDDGFTRDDYLQLVNDIYTGKIEVSGDTSSPQPSADHLKLNFLGNLK